MNDHHCPSFIRFFDFFMFTFPVIEEDEMDEVISILALLCSMGGFLMKNKYTLWLGLLLAIMTVANRKSTASLGPSLGNVGFCVVGLVSLYSL
jgi:hypothetical protein